MRASAEGAEISAHALSASMRPLADMAVSLYKAEIAVSICASVTYRDLS